MGYCPFMSNSSKKELCTSMCQLHLNGGCAINVTARLLEDFGNKSLSAQRQQIAELDTLCSIVKRK